MKITKVAANNRKKAFEVSTRRGILAFPYAMADPAPASADGVVRVFVDEELGREGFTYVLRSGKEGSVHLDSVLEYNADARHMTDLLLYKLTLEAERLLEESKLSRREVIRRMRTSPAQLYRLLDPTNCRKSIGQMCELLWVLGFEVDFDLRERRGRKSA